LFFDEHAFETLEVLGRIKMMSTCNLLACIEFFSFPYESDHGHCDEFFRQPRSH